MSDEYGATNLRVFSSVARGDDRPTSMITTPMNYRDIITIEPGKRGGKPCIRRMRITVYDVLGWLASGMSHADILDDFPELTETDILACLAFVADRSRLYGAPPKVVWLRCGNTVTSAIEKLLREGESAIHELIANAVLDCLEIY